MDYGIKLLLDSIIYQSSHGFFANVSTAPRLAPLRSGGVSLKAHLMLMQPRMPLYSRASSHLINPWSLGKLTKGWLTKRLEIHI
jgi:hypothetical protein